MTIPNLKIQCHYPGMPLPQKNHATDSGIDLTVMKVVRKRDNIFFFDLGISIEPPQGYYAELFPRSSSYKHDFIMANSVGVIDSDYRGVIMMPMRYIGEGDAVAEAEGLIGQRVGQLILKKLEPVEISIVDSINTTVRGDKGFGSSGQ